MLDTAHPDRTAALRALFDQRVAVLDGAWGSMFQGPAPPAGAYPGRTRPASPRASTGAQLQPRATRRANAQMHPSVRRRACGRDLPNLAYSSGR